VECCHASSIVEAAGVRSICEGRLIAGLGRFRLARDSEVNVIVLIMPHPGLALHERQFLLQVCATFRSEQSGEKLVVEDCKIYT
jgi:hypothetical protein